ADEIGAHREGVLSDNPSQSVSEGCQVLIHGTVSISVAILKYCKVPSELYGGVTMCRQLRCANDRSISVNVRLIESNPREKTFERRIAVAAQPFPVKSAACF